MGGSSGRRAPWVTVAACFPCSAPRWTPLPGGSMGGQGLKLQRLIEAVATIQERGRWLRSGWGWRTRQEVVRSCVCLKHLNSKMARHVVRFVYCCIPTTQKNASKKSLCSSFVPHFGKPIDIGSRGPLKLPRGALTQWCARGILSQIETVNAHDDPRKETQKNAMGF
ncbi:uncharacterized protein LOC119866764 isoform X4 [Canis lupus familiaris]|uniref:uncharacterized protein LOC119866764 isoform X4 n=1 Tax=Canis lupus familiaris TaxID=9615 RepID=UPI0018F46B28|nr:uncharacterized protein LOC119866764 isoform X4 [Canis lupus familiaris]